MPLPTSSLSSDLLEHESTPRQYLDNPSVPAWPSIDLERHRYGPSSLEDHAAHKESGLAADEFQGHGLLRMPGSLGYRMNEREDEALANHDFTESAKSFPETEPMPGVKLVEDCRLRDG